MDTEKITIRPSIIALLIQFISLAIPLFIFCLISAVITRSQSVMHIAVIRYQVFCLLLLLNQVRLYFNQLLVLDEKTVTFFYGRLSLNYKKTAIAYQDIRESSVRQNIFGRIFNYGNISFASAGTGHEEIVCKNIDKPRVISGYVQKIISETHSDSAKRTAQSIKINNK